MVLVENPSVKIVGNPLVDVSSFESVGLAMNPLERVLDGPGMDEILSESEVPVASFESPYGGGSLWVGLGTDHAKECQVLGLGCSGCRSAVFVEIWAHEQDPRRNPNVATVYCAA